MKQKWLLLDVVCSSEVVANVFLVMLINKIPIPFSLVYMGGIMIFCILITLFHPLPYSKVKF